MIRKRKTYIRYTIEFKPEAIRLMEESGRLNSGIAMELGIRRNQLYKWKEQMKNDKRGRYNIDPTNLSMLDLPNNT